MHKFFALFLLFFATQLFAQQKNNILFIAVDDLKPLLSNYGNKQMHTPNFDRLAAMGVTFTNAHVQQAVCGPSRASVMTGTTPDMTRVWDLHTDFRESNPALISMPEYLISQGYETTAVGKIYHKGSTSPGHDGKSWTIPHGLPEGNDPVQGEPAFGYYQDPATKAAMAKIEAELQAKGQKGNLRNKVMKKVKPSTESMDVVDEAYQDGAYTVESIKRLRMLAAANKPFFLGVGYQKPHLPFVAPKKYWDLYKREDIQLEIPQNLGKDIPKIAFHTWGELRAFTDIPSNVELGETLPEAKQRELLHGYMACISYIDAQLGKLLDVYDELGLAKNTNIVLWGDHGFHLGDHTIWCKHSNFEQATHIPLMFAGPGVEKGASISQPVELLDVFPTLFDLAGVPQSTQTEGVSLLPLMDGKKKTKLDKDYAISQYPRQKDTKGYTIRTERYRYTEWHTNNYNSRLPYSEANISAVELYDYQSDPKENYNFAENEKYKDIKADLKQKLTIFLRSKEDPNSLAAKEPFVKESKNPANNKNKNKEKQKNGKQKNGKNGQKNKGNKKVKERNAEDSEEIDGSEGFVHMKQNDEAVASAKKANKSDFAEKKKNNKSSASAPTTGRTGAPNVLVIIADDLGYHDLSCTGSKIYETPNIDRLATQSTTFTNGYSSYPRCTPSRYGMMTATYPINENHGELSTIPTEQNFIRQFDAAGYQTSYVGKWHLGDGADAPKGFGFDHSFAAGASGGTGSHFYPFNNRKNNKEKDIEDVTENGKEGDYLADVLTNQTMDFIKNADSNSPFFAVLAHYAVHTPIEAKEADRKRNEAQIAKFPFNDGPEEIEEGTGQQKMKQNNAEYAGMVENLDENVGRLLQLLEERGLDKNTIIVFTSDHGGLSNRGNKGKRELATSNLPLRAGKGHLYEGGIRVPYFIKWADHIKPKVDEKNIVLGMDIMPTLLDLALDTPLPNVDGKSFENVLNGDANWDDRTVFWFERKARPYSTGDSKCIAVRSGDYKMLHFWEDNRYEMYNIKKDIGEKDNLVEKDPKRAAAMKSLLENWAAEKKVKMK